MELIFQNNNLTIYNSIFEYIDSNMYMIIENNRALIIDPHKNDDIANVLFGSEIKDITIILTHEHPDHVSGLKWLQDNFKTTVISTKETSDYISDKKNTRPILISFILEEKDKKEGSSLLEKFNKEYEPFIATSDITFDEEFEYEWNQHHLKFKKLQGHSKGSCFVFLDDIVIFTGDTLLKEYPIITRFPRGNNKTYKNVTMPFIQNLSKDFTILPGHGKLFKLNDIFSNGKIDIEIK